MKPLRTLVLPGTLDALEPLGDFVRAAALEAGLMFGTQAPPISQIREAFDGKGGATAAQRWDVGKRVRDIEEAPDGSLWMLEDAEPGGLYHLTPKK